MHFDYSHPLHNSTYPVVLCLGSVFIDRQGEVYPHVDSMGIDQGRGEARTRWFQPWAPGFNMLCELRKGSKAS